MYQMNRPWLTLQKLSIKKAILLFRMIQPSILCKYLPLYTQFNQNRLGLEGRILPDLKVIIFCPIVILAIKTRSTAFLPSCLGEWKGLCQRTATSNRREELVAIFLQIFQTHAIDYWSVVTTVLDIGQEGLFGLFLLQPIISTIQVQGASQHNHHQSKSATRKHLLSSSIGFYEWKLAYKER